MCYSLIQILQIACRKPHCAFTSRWVPPAFPYFSLSRWVVISNRTPAIQVTAHLTTSWAQQQPKRPRTHNSSVILQHHRKGSFIKLKGNLTMKLVFSVHGVFTE